MYTFTKQHVENDHGALSEGNHTGTLIEIEDTISKKGDRMLKFSWEVHGEGKDHTVYDFILPEHERSVVRDIAAKKLSAMAAAMLDAKDGEDVNIFKCKGKDALVVIKNQLGQDGNLYPRIAKVKKSLSPKVSKVEGTILPDDDCAF